MDLNEFTRSLDKPMGTALLGDPKLRTWIAGTLSFGSQSFFKIKFRLILDPQQPRLEAFIEKRKNGIVIITIEAYDFNFSRQSLYRDCLTVDAAQGQEEPIVIFLLSKPRPVAEEVRFIANKERLNVALSRAQKAVVVVGNARLWNTDAIKAMGARSKSLAFFCGILKSLTAPGTRRVLRNQAQFTATSSNAVPISMQMDVDSPAFDTFAAPTPRVRLPPVSRTRSRSRSRSPNANTAYRERSPHMSTMHSKVSYVNLWLEQKVKDLKGSLRRYEAVLEMVEAQAAADIAKAKLDVVQVRQQLAELLTKAQDEEMDLGD